MTESDGILTESGDVVTGSSDVVTGSCDVVTKSGCGMVALILTPTRELALQVHAHIKSVARYTKIKVSLHTLTIFFHLSVHTHNPHFSHSYTLSHSCPHTGMYSSGWHGNRETREVATATTSYRRGNTWSSMEANE